MVGPDIGSIDNRKRMWHVIILLLIVASVPFDFFWQAM